MYNKELTPENESQELWELNGRVKAVVSLLRMNTYVNHEEIIAMLTGGEDDGLFMQGGD